VALALILNTAWADIKCDVTVGGAPTEQTCSPQFRYCHVETDGDGVKTYGCGLCPNGAGPSCEQCVGNENSPCNREGASRGPICDVTLTDGNTVTPVFCSDGVKLCHSEKDTNGKKVYGCGLCSGGGTDCEQCVGSDAGPCNKEGTPRGPICDVTDGNIVTPAFCSEGVKLCYSPTGSNPSFTTYGCGFCAEGKQGNGVDQGCKQCVGNSDTQCNTDTYKPGAQCYVENKAKDGLTPVDCPTDTVLCYSPKSAYTGVGNPGPRDWSKYGCGICPETDQGNCMQCEGTSACNRGYSPNNHAEILCGVTIKDRTTHPAKCSPFTKSRCYRQLVGGSFLHYEYGCGECPNPSTGMNCVTCDGYRESEKLCKFSDDEHEDFSHGNIMMLNTLLFPLLLALWV